MVKKIDWRKVIKTQLSLQTSKVGRMHENGEKMLNYEFFFVFLSCVSLKYLPNFLFESNAYVMRWRTNLQTCSAGVDPGFYKKRVGA